MAKLIFISAIVSIAFLTTQVVVLYYGEISYTENSKRVVDENLFFNVKLIQGICKAFKLICVLIDKEILLNFHSYEIRHREKGIHDHNHCELFCEKLSAIFLISGVNFNGQLTKIRAIWEEYGFYVKAVEDLDMRHDSLERVVYKKLVYHIFLTRNSTLIHLVISYPRFKHHWIKKCDMKSVSIPLLFSQQSLLFGSSDYIFKFPTTVTALIDGIFVSIPQHLKSFLQDFQTSEFIPCNFAQARSFYSLYGYENNEDSEIFRSKARNILEIVTSELFKLNVPFWLSSGTLLGWYRQCDFIPYSRDVDIGIWIKNYNQSIISSFKERGFRLKQMLGKVEDSFELSFEMENVKLDIFFFYEDSKYMWNGGTQVKSRKKFKYIFPKFLLCWSELNSILVRVPCKTHLYIEANYGKHWRVPVKTWDWKSSPSNVYPNGEWPIEEHVIQMY